MKTIKGWKDIPYSDKANEIIAALKAGIVLAVRVKNANSSEDGLEKFQIEFAEKINNNGEVSALALFNTQDKRFTSGAQRVWLTADGIDVERVFGKEIFAELDKEASVEILKEMTPENGVQFRIKVIEILESQFTDKEKEYSENTLKRAGAEGNYFYAENGERVGTRRELVVIATDTNPSHTYITGSFREESVEGNVMSKSNKPALSADMQGA